jgi:long-chain acyl-CoA synthetase
MSTVAAPREVVGSTRTFIGPLERGYRTASDQPAVVCGGDRWSYDELLDRTRRLVGALRGLGLRRGDRVAVVSPNCHRYLELYLAVPAGGFVLVPLNARHAEPELRYALEDSGASVLFVGAEHASTLSDAAEHVIALPGDYDELIADVEPDAFGPVVEDDVAGLFYTGGTTGASKGVMLSHGNLVANAFHFMACWPFTRQTRWLVVAPMFHAAGTIGALATIWAGGSHVILPGFDPAAALDTIERERITATLLVPTMLAALAEEQSERPRDVSSLRYLSHGGSPVATQVLHAARAAFPDASLLHVYGATETSPILTLLPEEENLLDTPRARSCGQPAIGIELEVVDSHRRSLPPGEVGEVRARGANIMKGYWNKPAETAAALDHGWYLTGDLGYLDDEAYLFLVDRAKDMIITGGENVYSTEVEEALYRHPAVAEAAVFALPDDRWGESVCAAILPRGEVTEAELAEHTRALIADYKVPKRIFLRTQPLPKSGAGKVLKRTLRDQYLSA